jgi:hypothetical protein
LRMPADDLPGQWTAGWTDLGPVPEGITRVGVYPCGTASGIGLIGLIGPQRASQDQRLLQRRQTPDVPYRESGAPLGRACLKPACFNILGIGLIGLISYRRWQGRDGHRLSRASVLPADRPAAMCSMLSGYEARAVLAGRAMVRMGKHLHFRLMAGSGLRPVQRSCQRAIIQAVRRGR